MRSPLAYGVDPLYSTPLRYRMHPSKRMTESLVLELLLFACWRITETLVDHGRAPVHRGLLYPLIERANAACPAGAHQSATMQTTIITHRRQPWRGVPIEGRSKYIWSSATFTKFIVSFGSLSNSAISDCSSNQPSQDTSECRRIAGSLACEV